MGAGAKGVLIADDLVPGGAPVDNHATMLCEPRVGIFKEMADMLNTGHDLNGTPIEPFNCGEDGNNHWYMPSSLMDMIRREERIRFMLGASAEAVITGDKRNFNQVKE